MTYEHDILAALDSIEAASLSQLYEQYPSTARLSPHDDSHLSSAARTPGGEPRTFGAGVGNEEPEPPEYLLRRRLLFLMSLRTQMEKDPELLRFIDGMIAQRVKAAERRQRTYSIAVTVAVSVASLIAGWLLSAISPVSALTHLLPR